uniref:Solute carrier family 7 member 14 n=1 Tax=Otolemur garnettii TaxID=30611 RepID=H0XCP8_OTOGA
SSLCVFLTGVCYAEFGVRVPKTTGSAYTYSYVTIGEFVAFFIGWNLILEYLIGTAAGASALSSMFDSLANHTISRWMVDSVGTLNGLGKGEESYPDLLALLIAVIVTIIVALGVKNSVGFNNVLNVLNLAVWVFIVIAGLFFTNGKYWAEGQFLPHGWSGTNNSSRFRDLSSSGGCPLAPRGPTSFLSLGFQSLFQSSKVALKVYILCQSLYDIQEECMCVQVTTRTGPSLCTFVCDELYAQVSMILTLMVPYYAIDTESPLMEMFVAHGFYAAKFIVAIGSVAGLTVSLLGSLFPMPRVIYAMAGDGLLFRFLAHVSSYTETPVVACIVSGFLAALLSLLVSLRDLIEMMSIGTLLAYTLVSVCVLLLRYQPESDIDGFVKFLSEEHTKKKEGVLADCEKEACSPGSEGDEFSGPATNTCGAKNLPSLGDNEMLIGNCVLLLFILMFIFCSFIIFGSDYISGQSWWAILLVVLMVLLIGALVFVILQQPENPKKLPYMAPCVPFVPACAMLVNIYLMLKLSTITWVRFAVWCFVG